MSKPCLSLVSRHRPLLFALLLLPGVTLPAAAVDVDIILYNGTSSQICNYSALPIAHYYSLYVETNLGAERVCGDVTWKFYRNGVLVETFHSDSSLELVGRSWPDAGTGRIEVQVSDCGFLTSSGSTAMNLTIGPVPPAVISGPSSLCPSETATFSIASVPSSNSYNWQVPSGWQINGGGTALSSTSATSISVTAPAAGTASSGQVQAAANYYSGSQYPNCGTSGFRAKTVALLSETLPRPIYITGPQYNLCDGSSQYASATYQTPAVAGASSYEWEVYGGASLNYVTYTPSLTLTSASLNGPGTYGLRVRALNRCGAISDWQDVSIYVQASTDPGCQVPCNPALESCVSQPIE